MAKLFSNSMKQSVYKAELRRSIAKIKADLASATAAVGTIQRVGAGGGMDVAVGSAVVVGAVCPPVDKVPACLDLCDV